MARDMNTVTTELPKSYVPAEAEGPILARWEESRVFHADPAAATGGAEPYCILIPPPNVTAALHLGHALNNTLQDVLVRVHRMRGRSTLWMPGTDHAGIATQAVVEKRLKLQEGRSRDDFTRAEFVARVQAWKDEYEATITAQLKAMGCSCDWERQRFTMDPMCAAAVREAFFLLFRDGLVQRGKRLVNWDPVTRTALADDEVEMEEVQGRMWYLRYPLEPQPGAGDEQEVVVATTRPETMLGDTAVAINPADPRAAALRGRRVRLPLVNRVVPIVEDGYVVLPETLGGDPADPKAAFATGFLKVTPAHDPNDWEIARRHGLPVINVLAPDATISRDHGWPAEEFTGGQASAAEFLLGMSREAARAAVVKWFEDHGLLAATREYAHSVGHSYRSHVPIEPYLSDQWYVRVTDQRLAGEALRALCAEQYEGAPPPRDGGGRQGDGELRFFPARYARTFQSWHEGLRDWCISRQIWWGHRIPVWSGRADGARDPRLRAWEREQRVAIHVPDGAAEATAWVCVRREDDGQVIRWLEERGFIQDPDVLDTWFSSALWPISTMGWPHPRDFPETTGLLERFNPSSVLCTGRDIITLWVSRMVMFNRYFRDGLLPFRHVYINPMIQDGHGQRMSKSLGNGVDPRDIIHSHGADALRFALCQIATATQDVRLPVDMLCPACGAPFHPKEITSPSGHRVAAPRQECPACRAAMVSGYGVASGSAAPAPAAPLARNTSTRFDEGRNFANKLWNATRFALRSLPPSTGPAERDQMPLVDRWIVSRLHQTLHAVEDALAEYQLSVYADSIYAFVWGDFCDWYLEAIKPTVRESGPQQSVLRTLLGAVLRLVHPICPFVTEALWPHVRVIDAGPVEGIRLLDRDTLAASSWPWIACRVHDEAALVGFQKLQRLVEAVRGIRGTYQVPPRREIRLLAPAALVDAIEPARDAVRTLAGLGTIEALGRGRPERSLPLAFEGEELLLTGVVESIDLESERARLLKLVEARTRAVEGFRRKLENTGYVRNAPAEVVEQTRQMLKSAEADLAAAARALESLQGF
jgi:valyl-tRNA synthetase